MSFDDIFGLGLVVGLVLALAFAGTRCNRDTQIQSCASASISKGLSPADCAKAFE